MTQKKILSPKKAFLEQELYPLLAEYTPLELYDHQPEVIKKLKKVLGKSRESKDTILKYLANQRTRYVIGHELKYISYRIKSTDLVIEKVDKEELEEEMTYARQARDLQKTKKRELIDKIKNNVLENQLALTEFNTDHASATLDIASLSLEKCKKMLQGFSGNKTSKRIDDLMLFYQQYLDPIMDKIRKGEDVTRDILATMDIDKLPSGYSQLEKLLVSALKNTERAEKSELYMLSNINTALVDLHKSVNLAIMSDNMMKENGNITVAAEEISPEESDDHDKISQRIYELQAREIVKEEQGQ